MAKAVKKAVTIPVVPVGVILEQVLEEGKVDFVAVSRSYTTDAE